MGSASFFYSSLPIFSTVTTVFYHSVGRLFHFYYPLPIFSFKTAGIRYFMGRCTTLHSFLPTFFEPEQMSHKIFIFLPNFIHITSTSLDLHVLSMPPASIRSQHPSHIMTSAGLHPMPPLHWQHPPVPCPCESPLC